MCSVERCIVVYNALASGIFAVRNADKTSNGEVGRSAVALGQTAGVIQEIAKYDGLAAKTARSAVSVFSDLAKQHKAFEYAGKATQFAVNNVNPLICVSGAIKTATSDDKVKTGITELAALSTMFAGEDFIKRKYDKFISSKTCKNVIAKASENRFFKPLFDYLEKHKLKGRLGFIIKGLVFVASSMTAYSIGHKMGDEIADRVKANIGLETPKKINQMT